jgi:uncharacterized membrane protein (UPF0127 family)
MDLGRYRAAILCTLLLFACCQGERLPEPQETPSAAKPKSPQPTPRPGLHKLTIRDAVVYVDIAQTTEAREQGLMFRKNMPENEGMLFIYAEPDMLSFWMKNTEIPLSLAYIDETGRIFQFVDMKPHDETSHKSTAPAQYVLEVNVGWFRKHGVKTGDVIENLPTAEGADY